MAESPLRRITSADALEHAFAHSESEPVVLYKHSLTCPLSAMARHQIQKLTGDGDPRVYEIVVQEARAVSNDVAERLGIRHESPQVIVLRHRKPIFDTSHGRVSAEVVRHALAEV